MRIAGLFVAVALATVVGCGGNSRPKTVPISGSISYGGAEWPAEGQLHFLPLEPAEGYPRRNAVVDFGQDGKFSSPTSWEAGDGVVPGKYRVYVECWKIKPTIDGPPPVSYVSDKFMSGAQSDIEVEITADSSDETFHWDIAPNQG